MLMLSWNIVDLAKIWSLTSHNWVNFFIWDQKAHQQSWALVQSNPLFFFSLSSTTLSFEKRGESYHQPPPPARPRYQNRRVRVRVNDLLTFTANCIEDWVYLVSLKLWQPAGDWDVLPAGHYLRTNYFTSSLFVRRCVRGRPLASSRFFLTIKCTCWKPQTEEISHLTANTRPFREFLQENDLSVSFFKLRHDLCNPQWINTKLQWST